MSLGGAIRLTKSRNPFARQDVIIVATSLARGVVAGGRGLLPLYVPGDTIVTRCLAHVAWLLVLAGCLLPPPARGDDPPASLKPPEDQAELEPEEVARRFFIAVMTKDKAAIERYTLPEEHREVLWKGPPISETMRRAIQKQVGAMQFRRLKPGDTVTAENGKQYTIEERQVHEGRMLLLPKDFRLPFALVKQPDGWKVKATSMIESRLEAKEDAKEKDKR